MILPLQMLHLITSTSIIFIQCHFPSSEESVLQRKGTKMLLFILMRSEAIQLLSPQTKNEQPTKFIKMLN